MVVECVSLGNETFQKIVDYYLNTKYSDPLARRMFRHQLNYASRRGKTIQDFEDWLWKQGASIRQKDGRRYLEFTDPQQATIFVLKWA